jgi:phosphoribosyl 1,2-cyclic phosphodiesterase
MVDMLRYGGNTTSFKVEIHNVPPIYIDGGTGLYEEGIRLFSEGIPEKIYVLMTHTHWDHILSFPYFKPLYEPSCHVEFYASVNQNRPFIELIQGQHNPRAFPVPFSQLKARQTFVNVASGDRYDLSGATIEALQLNHPGMTLGWRINGDGRSVAIITDNAPIKGNYLGEGMAGQAQAAPELFEQQFEEGLIAFIKDADLVIYDTHFSEETIRNRRHWGHSTPEMAIDHCKRAGVRRLILHHHAPEDNDQAIDAKAEKAWKAVAGSDLQVEPGTEDMRIWL